MFPFRMYTQGEETKKLMASLKKLELVAVLLRIGLVLK